MVGSVLLHTRAPVGGDTAVLYAKHPYVHQHVKMADLAQHPGHVIVPLGTQVLPVPMVFATQLVNMEEFVLHHSFVNVNLAIMGISAKKVTI